MCHKATILFSDNSLWGVINFRGYIIENLLKEGFRIVIVAPKDNALKNALLPSGVIYEHINMQRNGTNPISDLKYMLQLKKMYQRYTPILVFQYTIKPNIYGTFAAVILKIPVVSVVTGLGYVFQCNSFFSNCIKRLYGWALSKAFRVIFLNEENYSLVTNMVHLNKDSCVLLKGGEGIDVSLYQYCIPLINKEVSFLMVARVLYDKGYYEFVEAARKNPQAKFILIGAIDSNPESVPYETVMSDVNMGYIEYHEFMPKEDVKKYMLSASCVVLPSYHEGMSTILMEALAMGKPIICTDIAGCREMVSDGINGFLVPSRNAIALSEACNKFVKLDKRKIEIMSHESRIKAEEHFDIKNTYQEYLKIISNLSI